MFARFDSYAEGLKLDSTSSVKVQSGWTDYKGYCSVSSLYYCKLIPSFFELPKNIQSFHIRRYVPRICST